MLAGVFSLAFSFSIGMLLATHTYLLARNFTTIEMGGLIGKNPFSQGSIYKNLEQTLGKDWRLWLVPVDPIQRGNDGINHSIIPVY